MITSGSSRVSRETGQTVLYFQLHQATHHEQKLLGANHLTFQGGWVSKKINK